MKYLNFNYIEYNAEFSTILVIKRYLVKGEILRKKIKKCLIGYKRLRISYFGVLVWNQK